MQSAHVIIVALLNMWQTRKQDKRQQITTKQIKIIIILIIKMMITVQIMSIKKIKKRKKMTTDHPHLRRCFCSRRLCNQHRLNNIKITVQQIPQLLNKLRRHHPHYNSTVCHSTHYFSVPLSITLSHLLEAYTLFISYYEHHMYVQ